MKKFKKLKLNLGVDLKRIIFSVLIPLGLMSIISACGPMPPGPPPRLFGPIFGPEGVWFILLLAIVGVAFWVTQQRSHVNDKPNKEEDLLGSLIKRFDSLERRLDKLEKELSEIKKGK